MNPLKEQFYAKSAAGNTYCKFDHSKVTKVIQHYLVEQLLTAR
jgi:hypothetical protein